VNDHRLSFGFAATPTRAVQEDGPAPFYGRGILQMEVDVLERLDGLENSRRKAATGPGCTAITTTRSSWR
jgi:hypothetical protein